MLEENEVLRVLCFGVKSGEKFPELARNFIMGYHYHSPRAYRHIREAFKNTLPHPKTIQKWCANSDVNSEPGIQSDNMAKLKRIADQHKEKTKTEMICTLIID